MLVILRVLGLKCARNTRLITIAAGLLLTLPPLTARADDYLDAVGAEMGPDGTIVASGGAVLHLESLVEGAEVVISAEEAEYNPASQYAELRGSVMLELVGYDLRITCQRFTYDPLMGDMEVEGVRVQLPLTAVIDRGRLPDQDSFDVHTKHIYNFTPDYIYFASGHGRFDLSTDPPSFVMQDVTVTHNPHPEPDLYIRADEIRMSGDDRVVARDIGLVVAGWEVFSWPRVSRSLHPTPRTFSLDFPYFAFNRDEGLTWKQRVKVDLDQVRVDGLLDVTGEYGVLGHAFVFTTPAPNAILGVSYGTRALIDINQVDIERRDDFNLVYNQDVRDINGPLHKAQFEIEYGNTVVTTRARPTLGIPETTVEDTRTFAAGDIEFDAVELAENVYLSTGALLSVANYEDSNETYRVAGVRAGVIWRTPEFDQFVLYKTHDINGSAVFSFDQVRRQEFDFATSFRLVPAWRQVVRGQYDIDDDEFDLLQVGALKKQRTFELGLYYDFARENAGIEIGFLVD